MEERTSVNGIDQSLSLWRDSCLFYFKFDLALIASVAAAASFFKLEGNALIEQASQYESALQALIGLVIYAIAFEYSLTTVRNSRNVANFAGDEQKTRRLMRIFSLGYTVQVFTHAALLAGALGYASGFVDAFMSVTHAHR
ncbi:MAG: hypothetical protein WA777_11245 [Rhodanobacter sp.]